MGLVIVLTSLYAILTIIACISQIKEAGIKWNSILFIFLSVSMVITLFLPTGFWVIFALICTFIGMHIAAVKEGLMGNGQLRVSHHAIRFVVHIILVGLAFKFLE